MQARPKPAVKVTRKVDGAGGSGVTRTVAASSNAAAASAASAALALSLPQQTPPATNHEQNHDLDESLQATIDDEPSNSSITSDVAAVVPPPPLSVTGSLIAAAPSSASTLTPPRSKDAGQAVSPRGTNTSVTTSLASARFRTPPKASSSSSGVGIGISTTSDKKSIHSATTLSRLSRPVSASSNTGLGTSSASKRTSMAPTSAVSSSASAVSSSTPSAPNSSPSTRRISTLPLSATGTTSAHITIKPKTASISRPSTATSRPVSIASSATSSAPPATAAASADDKSIARAGHSRLPSTAASAAAAAVRRANLAAKASETKSSLLTSKLSKLQPLLTPSTTAPSSAVNSPQSGKIANAIASGTSHTSKPVSSVSTPSATPSAEANASSHTDGSNSALSASHLVAAALLAEHDSDDEVDGDDGHTSPDSSAANSPAIIVKTKSATATPNVEVPISVIPPRSLLEHAISQPVPASFSSSSSTSFLAPAPGAASNAPLSLFESQLASLQSQVTQLTIANSQQTAQFAAAQSAAAVAQQSTRALTESIEASASATSSQQAEQQRQLIETVTTAVTAQINASLPNLIQMGVQTALQAAIQPAINAALPSSINASLPVAIESIFESSFSSRLVASIPALVAPMLETARTSWLSESNQSALALLQGYETENQKELESKERDRQDQYETDTVRMLANIASAQTNIQATTASLDRLAGQVEEQDKRINELNEERGKMDLNMMELIQKISAVEAGAVLLRSDLSTAHATDVDHAMLLSEHKKTLMHLTRLVQEHTDRLVEWEGLSQNTTRMLKQHEEVIKLQAKLGTASNEHAAAAVSDNSTTTGVPSTDSQTTDTSSSSSAYPSIVAFDALRGEHNELKSSLAEKSVQLEQMRTIVMKLITRGGSGGLDILASLISPSLASSPNAAAGSAASSSSVAQSEDIEAKWAAKKAERAAKSAAKHPNTNTLAIEGVTSMTTSAAPSPSIQPTPAPNITAGGLSVTTIGSGFSGISSSPNQSPRPSFTLDGSPASSLHSTPAASPHRPMTGTTAGKVSSFSLSSTNPLTSEPSAAAAALDADRKKKGVWATPAVPRPGKAASEGVSLCWTVHFNSARQYIPAPPLKLLRLQQKTRPSKAVANTPRRPGVSTSTTASTLPLTTHARATSANTTVGVSLEDLPASSKKRKSHLRHQAIESRAGADLETYVEPQDE